MLIKLSDTQGNPFYLDAGNIRRVFFSKRSAPSKLEKDSLLKPDGDTIVETYLMLPNGTFSAFAVKDSVEDVVRAANAARQGRDVGSLSLAN